MLKVLRPSKNKVTQGYSDKHKAYDFSGKGDLNAYSSLFGKVIQSKNSETKNWINKGTLTTADYGNYCKIKGEINGKIFYQLCAHLEPGTVLQKGEDVKRGQVIGKIGNTGNSTARHVHVEYRDENNHNIPVEFVEEVQEPVEGMTKRQQVIEAYMGTRPDHSPSEDEISYRLQENKGLFYIIRDILEGDTNAREYWLDSWEIKQADDINYQKIANDYKDQFEDIKQILGLSPADNVEEVKGKLQGMLDLIKKLQAQQEPKVIYKYKDKDYQRAFLIGNILIAIERGD